MAPASKNSFGTRDTLTVDGKSYEIFRLSTLEKKGVGHAGKLPFSLRVLLENLLRQEDDRFVHAKDIEALAGWNPNAATQQEISFMPARVLLQDFTGVPAVVDLAAMREAIQKLGGDPKKVNPLLPVELVIDHSVQVDQSGAATSFAFNAELEFHRNVERYAFLRWGQGSFDNFKVVPPDTGIVHQVNLEYLARVVFDGAIDGKTYAFPDSLVGTDSHTTMINGLGVFGWGVGGIEAEAAMLGQPLSLLIPEVVGFKLHGRLPEGATATDLVLIVTEMLRKKGVVGKFVEFYGTGLSSLSVADRATIANMAPEYGATMGFFPVDAETIAYLRFTGRDAARVRLVEEYTKAQGIFRTDATPDPIYTDKLELDLASVEPTLAGPKRPQDRVPLRQSKASFEKSMEGTAQKNVAVKKNGDQFELSNGSVVIAAITSCTNTSNPSLMLGAGLIAKKAVERGLTQQALGEDQPRARFESRHRLSGRRGPFEISESAWLQPGGLRLHHLHWQQRPAGRAHWRGHQGQQFGRRFRAQRKSQFRRAAFIRWSARIIWRRRRWWLPTRWRGAWISTWPPNRSATARTASRFICATSGLRRRRSNRPCATSVTTAMYNKEYGEVFEGDASWRGLKAPEGDLYAWEDKSTYIKNPPFFENITKAPAPLTDIRQRARAGDAGQQHHYRSHLACRLDRRR